MTTKRKFPRVLIGAPGSGSGKTLITCALLQLLKRRGYDPAAFKCGPDYIDPMFHKTVLGVPSRNLDLFLSGKEGILNSLSKGSRGKNIGIVEGVMGYFDGMGATSMEGSSYDISRVTMTPSILVINCKGMSRSVLPLAKGFCEYRKDNPIKGIILNNCSKMVIKDISDGILLETGVPVIGFLPALKDINFESRHLGLVMPNEIPNHTQMIDKVTDALEEGFDLDAFLRIANEAGELFEYERENESEKTKTGIALRADRNLSDQIFSGASKKKTASKDSLRIGIAMDEAFCFYYEDNLDLLEELGAELVPFSPIHDHELPDVSGVIIGGGYPELHAKVLSENASMRSCINDAAKKGLPILAECGGFLYLQDKLQTPDNEIYPMAGVFSGDSHMEGRLMSFGYVNVMAVKRNPYLYDGETIRGHEFHYYNTTDNGDIFSMKKPSGKREWTGYQLKNNALGGFTHMYYPSCETFIYRFLEKCSSTE